MNRLAKKVIKNLISRKRTISICESCTGGLLSFSLAKIPDASQIYSFGLITYSNKSKISVKSHHYFSFAMNNNMFRVKISLIATSM